MSTHRPLPFALAFLLVLAHAMPAAARPRLVAIRDRWGTGAIEVVDGPQRFVLERFEEPQAIHLLQVSPDGRNALVWHHGARPPRRLSTYELPSGKRIARFTPGVGGTLEFTRGNQLLLTHGCGTNCGTFHVFDLQGNELGGGHGDQEPMLSPSGRFLVLQQGYPSAAIVEVFDVDTGEFVYSTRAHPSLPAAWVASIDDDGRQLDLGLIVADVADWDREGEQPTREATLRLRVSGKGRKARATMRFEKA